MELHVLGPAFGLPSIDAECIATVAFLQLQLDVEAWKIVPSRDQARLPYLVDGSERFEGFQNIKRHFDATQHDANQRADSLAISSFLEHNAQTLLDISLYVSFENYSATRSAFTKILPWHANYIIPPKRRAAARRRTDHLGISSIDIDDVHEDLSNRPPGFDVGKEQAFEAETQKRASLLLPSKNTIRSLLQRPEHSAIFRLYALADNFFEPLQDMLGENEYFLGTAEPTAVDCLAYGYLSLMLYPKLPQDWLAKVMRKKYGKLVEHTERMHDRLRMQTNVDEVTFLAQCRSRGEVDAIQKACRMNLQWQPPARSSLFQVTFTILQDLISRVPLLGPRTEIVLMSARQQPTWRRYIPVALGMTATTLGLFGYYAFSTGLLVWPHGEEVHIFGKRRLADYGHLGAALAGVGMLGRQTQMSQESHLDERVHAPNPARVEMEVERNSLP